MAKPRIGLEAGETCDATNNTHGSVAVIGVAKLSDCGLGHR